MCALVFDHKDFPVVQGADEIRVEAAIGLLQEEGAAAAIDQIANPEADTPCLRQHVQLHGAFELFPAVEVADAPMKVLAEIPAAVFAPTRVVVAGWRVALRIELEQEAIVHRYPPFTSFPEQGLLVGMVHRFATQALDVLVQ